MQPSASLLGGEGGSATSAATTHAADDDETEAGPMMEVDDGDTSASFATTPNPSQPSRDRVLLHPQRPPPPDISEAVRRMYDVEFQGQIHSMLCLVSVATGNVYNINRKLRDAIYGSVRLGFVVEQRDGSYHLNVERRVAMKVVKRERLSRPQSEDPMKEIAVMQRLRQGGIHQNVMHLIEVVQDAENIYIILPFCDGGELCQWFEGQRRTLPEDVARRIFLQVLHGLQYLHKQGVVHRDLSLENLLVDQGSRCIIIDFGMCVLLDRPAEPNVWVHRQRACGKPNYMAPEIYDQKDFIAPSIDLWALGVILFIMLTGVPPVEKPWPLDRRYNFIVEGRLRELMEVWGINNLTTDAVDLLVGLLQADPRARLTTDQIIAHPWVAPFLPDGDGSPDGDNGGNQGASSSSSSGGRQR